MDKETTAAPNEDLLGGNFWLWVGLLLPPIAWITQLQAVYLSSEYGCTTLDFLWNHVASAVALLFSAAGGVIAWRIWRAGGSHTANEGPASSSRRQFMALLGVLTGALFTLIVFAQWLPTLVGVPCDK